MKEKIQKFMIGRYGVDEFSKFLLGISTILLLISILKGYTIIYLLALFSLVYSYYRIFSKNYTKRYGENILYLKEKAKLINLFNKKKSRVEQYKTHKFFKCPSCRQELRVPRGKGLITITCPKCKNKFDKRT